MQKVSQSGGGPDRAAELTHIRRSLSSIYHDINNPISILVGNAELLLEMATSAGLGPEFVDPLTDISRASQQITEHSERLMELKELLPD